jgi:hypothetical protein
MSSKKRKNDLPESAASEAAQAVSRNAEPSQPEPIFADDADDESDVRRQLAEMRARHDESQAKLAAALTEIERLRAAALAPCPRCSHYADWTVRVRTMAGQVHTVACPDGPATLIAHVKKQLAQFDPKWIILQQLVLVLPCEASSSSSDADSIDPALADDRTLASCEVSKGDVLELLVVDMEWSADSLKIIENIKHGGFHREDDDRGDIFDADVLIKKDDGEEIMFVEEMPIRDDNGALALSWAIVNAVCLLLQLIQ